jgi:hypothetical protein
VDYIGVLSCWKGSWAPKSIGGKVEGDAKKLEHLD